MAKRPWPVWLLVVTDLLAFGVAICVFALFHHVIPRNVKPVGIVSTREGVVSQAAPVATQVPVEAPVADALTGMDLGVAPEASAPSAAQPAATQDPVGYFGTKFADKFTNGEVEQGEYYYRSANLNINIDITKRNESDVFVCDFYVRDIDSFCTAFAKDTYGRNYKEDLYLMAQRSNAIVCINGDFYGNRDDGAIIRNGVLYRDDDFIDCDMCVLYWDGTMKTFPSSIFDAEAEMQNGAYQSWTFGPSLLDENGNPKESFNTSVSPTHPRTALGYYEPGHYCFVAVDGRSDESEGVNMAELSQLMYDLGCSVAYNLDGGKTTQMLWGTEFVNNPASDGRECSDIILLREPQ